MQRSWWDLSNDEAQGIFDRYLAEHEGYVERFIEQRGTEPNRNRRQLDLSYESLRPAWTWHLEDLQMPRRRLGRGGPPSPESWVDDGPYWAAMHMPLVEQLGPTASWQVNDMAAYLFETVRTQRLDAALALDKDKAGADYNQPVLHLAGRPILRATQVLVLTRRAIGLDGSNRRPDRVDGLYRLVAHRAADPNPKNGSARRTPPSEPPVDVSGDRGEVVANFDDAIAHDRSADVDALVQHLAARPGVSAAKRTDREVVVVRTTLGPATIEEVINRYLRL